MELQTLKQRFGIIGTSEAMNRALEIAVKVAPTDLSVLVTGESGVGKEFFPQVIHACSSRKHNQYIAVNCGAIPEGTIDSELFGHEKGSFTGATEARKGYFEVADGGTIFLDEVAELPHSTQVRLLRVLRTGEFMRVGCGYQSLVAGGYCRWPFPRGSLLSSQHSAYRGATFARASWRYISAV